MSEEGQAAEKPVEEKKPSEEIKEKPAGGATVQEQPAETAVSGPEQTLKLPAEEMIKRRSRWQSSLAAVRYVSSVSRDNEVRIRDTDRATSIALLITCIAALLALVLPFDWLSQHRVPFVLAADVLVGVSLLMYVANRFGIVTTLTPRQALLTWQLMLGSSLLGIFMAVNLGLVIAIVVANTPPIKLTQ
jgi:hypothetical protein